MPRPLQEPRSNRPGLTEHCLPICERGADAAIVTRARVHILQGEIGWCNLDSSVPIAFCISPLWGGRVRRTALFAMQKRAREEIERSLHVGAVLRLRRRKREHTASEILARPYDRKP